MNFLEPLSMYRTVKEPPYTYLPEIDGDLERDQDFSGDLEYDLDGDREADRDALLKSLSLLSSL